MTHAETLSVCVIGLGSMGMGAAQSCINAGLETYGVDLNPVALETLQKNGAISAQVSADDFANKLDAVVVPVVNATQGKYITWPEKQENI